jgi:hypothetical protein
VVPDGRESCMHRKWRHIWVVLLLLLLAGESGITLAAGLRQCDSRCGCCDRFRHGVRAVKERPGGDHPMGSASHAVSARATGLGCCIAIRLAGCDAARTKSPALVSTSTRTVPLQGFGSHPNPAGATGAGPASKQGLAQGPFRFALLARPTAPIHLQINVLLC